MNRWFAAAFVAVIALAVALRAPELTLRPMHNDEGVNAIKFRALYVNHIYKYDPNEFHGPTLPYFTLPSAWLGGARDFNDDSEAMFRAVPVAFGVGLILLLWPLAGDLGRKQTLWAALFTAISPAMAFYSRDYIHEILLTFFTALAFIGGWRYLQTRRLIWACACGLGLGLMAATKETFVFALVAMGLAICSVRPKFFPLDRVILRHAAIGVLIALAVAALFFTSFFTNRAGLLDAARAYLPWLHRAGGASPHIHPWYFYLQRLFFFHEHGGWIWSEGVIGLLAVVGFLTAKTTLPRVIRYYTLFLMLIYSALPYKTPWCLLGFYHGMILLAGIGAIAAWEACRPMWSRWVMLVLLSVGCSQLVFQAWLANFGTYRGTLVCAAPSNPYVYAQTSPDITRLIDMVDGLARVAPQKFDTVVEVMAPESYWPLPWYLRRFQNVGYWDKIPAQPLAPIMIVSSSLGANFDERPEKTHLMAGYFKLRPDVFVELYVSIDLWTRYVQSGVSL
jgi:uncharacterized protein (TIGR03663 family)